ncbi:MAG: GHKL domain-containing protein [Calditrichaeota bacterium]|nr:GHKL domain-containing protein [Calditrichota bacterium]
MLKVSIRTVGTFLAGISAMMYKGTTTPETAAPLEADSQPGTAETAARKKAVGKVLLLARDEVPLRPAIQKLKWSGLEVQVTTSSLAALGMIADYDPEVLWVEALDEELSLEEIFDALKTPRQVNPITVVVSRALSAACPTLEMQPQDDVLDLEECAAAPTSFLQIVKLSKLERQVLRREHEVFDSLPNALLVVDQTLTLWKMNRRVSQLLEIPDPEFRKKALGRPLATAFAAVGIAADSATPLPELIKELERSLKSGRSRFRVKETIGATERLLSGEITPLVNSPSHALVDLRDITEDERAVLFEARRERLATIGNLSVGVAHEIQNPNTFSRVNASNLKFMFDSVRPLLSQAALATGGKIGSMSVDTFLQKFSECIAAVDMASRRIEAVLGTLKAFGRQDDGHSEAVDLREVISEAVLLVRHEARGIAEVHVELPDELPTVHAHSTGLSQVFVNMLQNAVHALAGHKAHLKNAEPLIRVTAEAVNDEEVIIAVCDNGPGIPEAIREKIFRPYFTTKPQGQGTGLGLSISSDMLHRFGGDLTLRSRDGEGTTFYIKLRRFDEPSENS